MKEIVFGFLLAWSAATQINHGKPLTDDFICFQPAPMMKDFLSQHPGWKNILHERGDQANEFFLWFNRIPPTSRIVADEVIVFGKEGKKFHWIWILHQGCWLNLFKIGPELIDVWLLKRNRKEAKRDVL